MYRDPRGGHNRIKVAENFFKRFTPQMAYMLGLIYADGVIEDARKSSRTCYFAISSVDKYFLTQVRDVISPLHKLYVRKPRLTTFDKSRTYLCAQSYTFRVANKNMYQDLLELGLTPRKSLRMKYPEIPGEYFKFFLRGYFDGDGCVSVYKQKDRKVTSIQVTFTSGTKSFLEKVATTLENLTKIQKTNVYHDVHAFKLNYKQNKALKLLSFMYSGLNESVYMARKYTIYQNYLKLWN